MPSVAEVIEHELFAGSRVVAGKKGLKRQVLWIHNSGVPDAAEWLNGGELVLTTMINLPEGVQAQRDFMQQLADKAVAGLVLTVGRYIVQAPQHLIEVANQNNFPLIEIPFEARFVDIAKAVNERIAQENMEMVRRALHIHQTLSNLVLEGGGFQHLATKLAELLQHSVSIENERFDAIATENIAEVDEARRYTQLHGRTDPRLVDALEQRGILPEIRQTLRPKHLEAMPDVGLEMERLLAPVVVHGEVYGFMWIIADEHRLTEIDMMAIESGSTIAALLMLYQESVQSAEASLKGNLISQLIQGDSQRETILTDQSLRFGLDLRSPYLMLVVEANLNGSQKLSTLYRVINQMIATAEWQAVAGQFAGQVIVLAQDTVNIKSLATKIQERITQSKLTVAGLPRVGVSGIQQGSDTVKAAYEQCQDVLHISRRLSPQMKVVYFNDLGYLHTLYRAGAETLAGNANVPILRQLLDEKQADLFRTLEAYLDAGGNGVNTAEVLHIHRSTLNYRLQRIAQVSGLKLEDPLTRMNLQVALKLMRLFEVDADSL